MNGVFYIGDERSRIRQIQERLRVISKGEPRVKPVFIDGIYGDETREAVRNVQEISEIAVTGEIDRETHEAIFALADTLEAKSAPSPYRPKFGSFEGGAISPGDDFDDVYLLQMLLRELSLKDDRFFVDINGVVDDKTESAVRLLQGLIGATEDGRFIVTEWNALVALTENTEGYI